MYVPMKICAFQKIEIFLGLLLVKAENYYLKDLNRSSFKDTENHVVDADIASLEKRNIIVATEYGIMSGYSDNTFKPNNTVSRHEVGKIVSNLYNYMLTEKVEIVPYAKKVTEEGIPISQLSNGIIENNLGLFYIQLTNMDKYLDKDYFVKIVCISHESLNIFYI